MHHLLLLHCQYVPSRTKRPADTASVHGHFEHTIDRHAINDAPDSVCHRTEVGAVDVMIYVPCCTKRPADTASVHGHFEHTTGRHAVNDAPDSVCH